MIITGSSLSACRWKFLSTHVTGKLINIKFPKTVPFDHINRLFTMTSILDIDTNHPMTIYIIILYIWNTTSQSGIFEIFSSCIGCDQKLILCIKSKAIEYVDISRCMITKIMDHLLFALTGTCDFIFKKELRTRIGTRQLMHFTVILTQYGFGQIDLALL